MDGCHRQLMGYRFRVSLSILAAVFWPPVWWQKCWHVILIAGPWFPPEMREFFEGILAHVGVTDIENWHYYTVAAALAIFVLALRIAFLTTPKVRFSSLTSLSNDDRFHIKLDVKNESSVRLELLCRMRLKQRNGKYLSIDGRDRFVLLTDQKRILAKRGENFTRSRFFLAPGEDKGIEVVSISRDLSAIYVFEEISGELTIPNNSYEVEVSVSGDGPPASALLSLKNYRDVGHIQISVRKPYSLYPKKLTLAKDRTEPIELLSRGSIAARRQR